MFGLLFLLLSFTGFDLLFGQECDLRMAPEQPSILVTKGDTISVVCDASCFGHLSPNQIGWLDSSNRRIPSSGRIFSLTYNRGMYARLILLNTDSDDTGNYRCIGRIDGVLIQRTMRVGVIDRDADVVEFVDEDDGRRRGDVVIHDPVIPKRRPVRDISLHHLLRRVRRQSGTDGSSTAEPDTETPPDTDSTDSTENVTTSTAATTSSTLNVSESTPYSDTSSTMLPTDDGSGTDVERTEDSTTGMASKTNRANTENTGSSDSMSETSKLESTTEASITSQTSHAPTSTGAATTSNQTPKPKPSGGNNDGDDESEEDGEDDKTAERSTTQKSEDDKETTVVHGPEARTAFGRYGLLAFALALSAAFLLFYTLILLNVILPRCCWKKRSVSFREEAVNKPKESGPSGVDFVALKPLNVESCPNSPDHGFTTVDLDDKADQRPDDKQNGKPVSPSSSTEPQSPSKFVTTFTIGRKPSTTDPSGVYIHEGQQGEVISALPEEGATPEQERKSSNKGSDTENDLDTSKDSSNTDSSGS